jgi:hypothetical protein
MSFFKPSSLSFSTPLLTTPSFLLFYFLSCLSSSLIFYPLFTFFLLLFILFSPSFFSYLLLSLSSKFSISPSPHPVSPFFPPPYTPLVSSFLSILLLPLLSSFLFLIRHPLLFCRNGMTPTFARTMYERGVERMASLLGFSDISMSKTSVSAVNGLLQSSKLSKMSSKQQKIEMVTRTYTRTYKNTRAYNDFFFFDYVSMHLIKTLKKN